MNEFATYSWSGIIDYIKAQKAGSDKEREQWALEKSNFLSLLQEKDLIIQSLQSENKELQTRIAILEYSIRQESQKTQKNHQRMNSDQLASKVSKTHTKLSSLDEMPKHTPLHRPSQSYGGFSESKFEISVPPARVCEDSKAISKKTWTPKLSLRSHLDSIRKLKFIDSKVLASTGEDCLVKLWNTEEFSIENDNIEPYATFRGHTASVFAMDAACGMIFTGDANGLMRSWSVPEPKDCDPNGPWQNFSLNKWKAHSDCIWSISYNSIDNCLLTSSSDSSVKLWRIPLEYRASGPQFKSFSYPGLCHMPTVCNWVSSNLKYITVGFSTFITVFNIDTAGFSKIPFASESNLPIHQVNCICTSEATSLTVAGHEDKRIRFFDLRSNSCIKDMVGHTDSVSDICIDKSGFYMISTGHDGSLRSWDLRNFHCLHEITLNRKKYDESIFCVDLHQTDDLLAIGGADSLIKILSAKD